MASGSPIPIVSSRQGQQWILVPHVDPAPARYKRAFMREIRTALKLRPREGITSTRLADALRNPTETRDLRDCYERIVPGGSRSRHNRVSMSLYSGPAGSKDESSWLYEIIAHPAAWPSPWWFETLKSPSSIPAGKAVGWIGTGDAELGVERVRRAWLKTYWPLSQHLSTLLLPHHGSRLNFHNELLDFPNLRICLASAGERYSHPDWAVIGEILNRDKVFCDVSESIHTRVQETIRLR